MKWVKRAVLLVLLVALSAGMWVTFVKPDDKADNPTTPTQPTETSAPFMRLSVSSVGGSGLAPDGKTRIGFKPTCEGAVQAAASYAKMSDGKAIPEDLQKKKEALKYVAWGKTEGLDIFRQRVIAPLTPPTDTHPEHGGFKVESCTPSNRAVIFVLWMQNTKGEKPEDDWGWFKATEKYTLAWLADDWRMTDYDVVIDDSPPGDPIQARQTTLTPTERKKMLAEVPGWQEFTNAPK